MTTWSSCNQSRRATTLLKAIAIARGESALLPQVEHINVLYETLGRFYLDMNSVMQRYNRQHREAMELRYPLADVPIPDGWRKVAFREPGIGEYFMSTSGRVGLQDGYVSFAGRDPVRIIVEKIPVPASDPAPQTETL